MDGSTKIMNNTTFTLKPQSSLGTLQYLHLHISPSIKHWILSAIPCFMGASPQLNLLLFRRCRRLPLPPLTLHRCHRRIRPFRIQLHETLLTVFFLRRTLCQEVPLRLRRARASWFLCCYPSSHSWNNPRSREERESDRWPRSSQLRFYPLQVAGRQTPVAGDGFSGELAGACERRQSGDASEGLWFDIPKFTFFDAALSVFWFVVKHTF